ncbi:hypothetical protein APHAL10511_006849 [Amanita phalloides]|nr:hypothetical protein APHAL10511_006849 [Amanita phalloides]
MAPHKKLPEDMIRCIFACVAQDRAIHFTYYRDDVPPQVVLSRVCSAWRQIALDMGSLWSCVTVVPRNNLRAFHEIWPLRITGHLTVYLTLPYPSCVTSREDLWDPLLRFQLTEIEFVMDTAQLRELHQISDEVSLRVERVGLVIKGRRLKVERPPQFISRLLYSFRLRASLENEDYGYFDPENFLLPWSQLRRLELRGILIHLSSFRQLLQQCTSLEACLADVCPARDADVMPVEPVNLVFLQQFTVIARTLPLGALSCLLLPDLRILEVRGGPWTDESHEVFRNQFNLERLHDLDITRIKNPPPLISILKDAPSLRRLYLPWTVIFDEESLCGLTNGQLGQHLESLRLFELSCNVDDIIKMVESRREARKLGYGLCPLFHVQMIYMGREDDELRNRLLAFNDSNMRIELVPIKEVGNDAHLHPCDA